MIFSLYSTCIPIKGYGRSIIYDLNRSVFFYVPNDLVMLMNELKTRDGEDLIVNLNDSNKRTAKQYLEYLNANELGFYIEQYDLEKFPNLDLSWDYPGLITNTIVDISFYDRDYLIKIIGDIASLGCTAIEIRFLDKISISDLQNALNLFNETIFQTIDIVIKNCIFSENEIIKLIGNHRIRQIVMYNCLKDESLENIIFSRNSFAIFNNTNKYSLFTINIPFFTEAQSFNTYFNRKLYLDKSGNIMNAPETNVVYGNILSDILIDIVSGQDFMELWRIPKTKIEHCSVCEYRFMCMDNRTPLKIDGKTAVTPYYYESVCEYNPYEMIWKNGYGKK